MVLTGLHRSAVAVLTIMSLSVLGDQSAKASAAQGSRVLYAANWHQGMHGWMKVGELSGGKYGDWTVKGGTLSGSAKLGSDYSPSALVAPIAMAAGRPYTVEARIRVMTRSLNSQAAYGIFAAGSLQSDPVYGRNSGVDGIFGWVDGTSGADLVSDTAAPGLKSPLAQSLTGGGKDYHPGSSWHLYRLSLHGSRFVFSIDGKTYVAGSASSYRNHPRVGIFTDQAPIQIQSFRVLTP